MCGILLGVCLTCEELVGVTWMVSDCEELWWFLTGDDGAEMLISALRSRRSISGPELAG